MSLSRIPLDRVFRSNSKSSPPRDIITQDNKAVGPKPLPSPPYESQSKPFEPAIITSRPIMSSPASSFMSGPPQRVMMGTRTPQMIEYERQAEERAKEQERMDEERARSMYSTSFLHLINQDTSHLFQSPNAGNVNTGFPQCRTSFQPWSGKRSASRKRNTKWSNTTKPRRCAMPRSYGLIKRKFGSTRNGFERMSDG